MKLSHITEKLRGIPNMTPNQGRQVYQHVIDNGVVDILEIGTAHGVSAAYAAAALDELGAGKIVTIDSETATQQRVPQPGEILKECGLDHLVERVLVNDSSYTWWLREKVAEQSDADGNCTPSFDFCYLDGAHNWTIDGLSVILVEKLLRPGSWLLLDDLDWTYDPSRSSFGPGQGPSDLLLSNSECSEPHMRAVFDLLVKQHPSFTSFSEQDGAWGWAKKDPDAERHYSMTYTVGLADRAKSVVSKARSLTRRSHSR